MAPSLTAVHPGDPGVRAKTTHPTGRKLRAMSTIEQPLTSTTWRVDPVHSTVGFAVKHMIVSTFRGGSRPTTRRWSSWTAACAIHGWVDVSSIVVKDPDLAVHLQSPEFFDAAEHPQMRFSSMDIEVGAGRRRRRPRRADHQGPHAAAARHRLDHAAPWRTPSAASAAAWSSRRSSIAACTAWSGTSRSPRAGSPWTTTSS